MTPSGQVEFFIFKSFFGMVLSHGFSQGMRQFTMLRQSFILSNSSR